MAADSGSAENAGPSGGWGREKEHSRETRRVNSRRRGGNVRSGVGWCSQGSEGGASPVQNAQPQRSAQSSVMTPGLKQHWEMCRSTASSDGKTRVQNAQLHRACPISTGGGTRRVRLVRGEGRGVSEQYRGGGPGRGRSRRSSSAARPRWRWARTPTATRDPRSTTSARSTRCARPARGTRRVRLVRGEGRGVSD